MRSRLKMEICEPSREAMDWMMSARERIKMKRRGAKETGARGRCGSGIHLNLPKQE